MHPESPPLALRHRIPELFSELEGEYGGQLCVSAGDL